MDKRAETFGDNAAVAEHYPNTDQRFETLKQKFAPLITAMDREGVMIRVMRIQDNKLNIIAAAPKPEIAADMEAIIDRIDPDRNEIETLFSNDDLPH